MNNSYADFNGILDSDNSTSGLTYYQPFKRTNDLASTQTKKIGKKFRQLEDLISPSNEPLDKLVVESISDLSTKMEKLERIPDQKIIISNIGEWIDKRNPIEDTFKNHLQNLGLTGKLVTVANRLNISLNNVDRHILASDGLFFYCAYRAVVGFNVTDADGIIANMIASLDKIKMEVNQNLVDKVIKDQNLKNDATLITKLKSRFAERTIPYEVGMVIPTIVREYKLIDEQGGLFNIVEVFLKKNNIKLPPGIDEAAFSSKMVSYLAEIGYKEEVDELEPIRKDLKDAKKDAADAKTDAEAAQKDVAIMKTDLETAKTDLETAKTDLDKKITDSNAALETAKVDLNKKLDDAKEECGEKCVEKCEEVETKVDRNMGSINDQLQSALNEITNLKAQVKKLENSNPVTGDFQEELNIVKIRIGNNLQEIEGIGPDYAGQLNESNISTFENLAAQNTASLKKVLPRVTPGYTHKDLIDQAKYIMICDFKKLKKLQDRLPRKVTNDVQID